MRLPVCEEMGGTGVRAWLSMLQRRGQGAGVLHVGSQLSAPAKHSSELAIPGGSLGLSPGKSRGGWG